MILILDNYDSFTYNIAQALGVLGLRIEVHRNDELSIKDIEALRPQAIVISPGPGRPEHAGISCRTIERFVGEVPILGVCLGHQCIAEVFGARVVKAPSPVHGKIYEIYHDGLTIYAGIRNPFLATRYHSLVVIEETVKDPLQVSSYTVDGEVMGIRCEELKIEGVQFHPESIATPQGLSLFRNFIQWYCLGGGRAEAPDSAALPW